jgi:hypothetical protein
LLGELVSIVNETVSLVDSHVASNFKVFRAIVLHRLHVHVRVVSVNWVLSKFLSVEEHRERVASIIGCMDLFHFDCVVAEEIVETIELISTVVAGVGPHYSEGEDSAVVVKERLQTLVGAASLEHHFDVVLMFS